MYSLLALALSLQITTALILHPYFSLQTQRQVFSLKASSDADNTPPPYIKDEPVTAKAMSQFKNKVPFSEDIYDHIKFVLSALSEKMRTKDAVLSSKDADRFVVAVAEILEDARKYGPPPRPKKIAIEEENPK